MARTKRKTTRKTASTPSKTSRKRTAKTAPKRATKATAGKARAAKTKPRAARAPRPMQLHYWPTPNGWKVTIMLEECRLPYEIVPVNLMKGEQFEPSFLKIAPNNRMPALVDPDGPGGRPISIFESGAILRYLGEKTGKFYPADLRGRALVDQWLFWQMAGLGPMAGQAHHFRSYAPENLTYAVERYTNEVNRLYGVLETRLREVKFLAGKYSIADMAAWPWILPEGQGQNLDDFPALKAWHERVGARPAVKRGRAVGKELSRPVDLKSDEEARKVMFGQRARVA